MLCLVWLISGTDGGWDQKQNKNKGLEAKERVKSTGELKKGLETRKTKQGKGSPWVLGRDSGEGTKDELGREGVLGQQAKQRRNEEDEEAKHIFA